jgi:phosphonoacetate hydrolase
MKAKARPDGTPNVVYLRPLLDGWVGPGRARVILPITDPYVVHHGALGSFATVHLETPADAPGVVERLRATPGIAEAHERAAGCRRFELPPDRTGDVVIVSDAGAVLGKAAEEHDLSLLREPLRSHGGTSEQVVPFVINRPVRGAPAPGAGGLRNFDLFEYVLNHAA